MTLEIICIGRLKEKYLREACAEYIKRLDAWAKVRVTELEPERLPDSPSPAEVERALQAEGARIEKAVAHVSGRAFVTALCIEGEKADSKAFAARISAAMLSGCGAAVFVIGGSYGLAEPVKRRADFRFSMSDMTFPHQLARVMLLEQLYRALNILNGGKYHK